MSAVARLYRLLDRVSKALVANYFIVLHYQFRTQKVIIGATLFTLPPSHRE
jgi:hypothetical protein